MKKLFCVLLALLLLCAVSVTAFAENDTTAAPASGDAEEVGALDSAEPDAAAEEKADDAAAAEEGPVLAIGASAEPVNVKVTIATAGELQVTAAPVSVSDADSDGAITVGDVLVAVHDQKFDGGAAAGYATADSKYGPAITKLWGVENGGSYGYYVNNTMSMGLTDPVAEGDSVYAYTFKDVAGFSDVYSFFTSDTATGKVGDTVSLTLQAVTFDENFAPVTGPFEGASILLNGEDTGVKTDKDGKAEVKLTAAGTAIISAVSDTATLVPPVCVATVEKGTNVALIIILIACAAVLVVAVVIVAVKKKKVK